MELKKQECTWNDIPILADEDVSQEDVDVKYARHFLGSLGPVSISDMTPNSPPKHGLSDLSHFELEKGMVTAVLKEDAAKKEAEKKSQEKVQEPEPEEKDVRDNQEAS